MAKAVCFLQAKAHRLLQYTCKILEEPFSLPVILAYQNDGMLSWNLVNATGKKNDEYLGLGGLSADDAKSYAEIFSKSKVVVISDLHFKKDGLFYKNGLGALVDFYKQGGVVIVDAEAGLFNVTETLNESFGCNWKLAEIDNFDCHPTDLGRELLGESAAPEIYFGQAHMLEVGDNEALYVPIPISRAEFMQDHCGIVDPAQYGEEPDLDSIADAEFVDDFREALRLWERHQSKARNAPLAAHRAAHGGRLVWVGDRAQEDTAARGVLARLLHSL